jgi:hypothetical protein
VKTLLVVFLFITVAVAQADSSLGGVTITNIKPDLANKTVSFTITNTTDKALTSWGVEIVSISGSDTSRSGHALDVITGGPEPGGVIPPGGHRDQVESLHMVKVQPGNDLDPTFFVDPNAADVIVSFLVFEDNRAFGPAQTVASWEMEREANFGVSSEEVKIIEDAKKADDPRAYIAKLIENLPKPHEFRQESSMKDVIANGRLMDLHRFLRQVNANLANPALDKNGLASTLDFMSVPPALEKARLEGHTKLIRVE